MHFTKQFVFHAALLFEKQKQRCIHVFKLKKTKNENKYSAYCIC